MLDQVLDHLLDCTDKLFEAGDSEKNGKSLQKSKQDNSKSATRLGQKRREPQIDASSSNTNGKRLGRRHVDILPKVRCISIHIKVFSVDIERSAFSNEFIRS